MNVNYSADEIKMYCNPNNAHKTIEDIFGSKESQITIEGKYQHILNYESRIEKLLNMVFVFG